MGHTRNLAAVSRFLSSFSAHSHIDVNNYSIISEFIFDRLKNVGHLPVPEKKETDHHFMHAHCASTCSTGFFARSLKKRKKKEIHKSLANRSLLNVLN